MTASPGINNNSKNCTYIPAILLYFRADEIDFCIDLVVCNCRRLGRTKPDSITQAFGVLLYQSHVMNDGVLDN